MSYQRYPNEIIEVECTEIVPAQHHTMNSLMPRRTRAMMSKVIEEAAVLDTHDRCLAMLAKSGMEHTAALAVLEAHFSRMTPQAAERYREIVDAYAQKGGGQSQEVVDMEICDVVILVLITIGVTGIVLDTFYGWLFRRLRSKYRMLQRLLLEQAELHEMSLEAYTAMLREAQRHMDD